MDRIAKGLENVKIMTKHCQNYLQTALEVPDSSLPGNGEETNPCYNSVEISPLTASCRCSKNSLISCTELSHVSPQEFCVPPLDI
jgi:hypothetical protein